MQAIKRAADSLGKYLPSDSQAKQQWLTSYARLQALIAAYTRATGDRITFPHLDAMARGYVEDEETVSNKTLTADSSTHASSR